MPTIVQNLNVRSSGTREGDNGYGFRKTGLFTFNSTYGSSGYIHMLTNIPYNNTAFYMIEAVGYNYGLSQDIYSTWGFRPNGINSDIKYSSASRTSGLEPDVTPLQGIYNSASGTGYVVVYAFAASFYYIGFTLNVFAVTNDVSEEDTRAQIPDVQITASSLNQTSGAYY